MNDTILNIIKEMLEVEGNAFDSQLLIYINTGISFLKHLGLNIRNIKSDTKKWDNVSNDVQNLCIQWLHIYTLQNFDKELIETSTTNNWLEQQKDAIIYQLKAVINYEK